jgi:hypothetical protein
VAVAVAVAMAMAMAMARFVVVSNLGDQPLIRSTHRSRILPLSGASRFPLTLTLAVV